MKRWTNGLPGATTRLGAMMAQRGLSAGQPRMRADIRLSNLQPSLVVGRARRGFDFCHRNTSPRSFRESRAEFGAANRHDVMNSRLHPRKQKDGSARLSAKCKR
jgi:hypothetical protein